MRHILVLAALLAGAAPAAAGDRYGETRGVQTPDAGPPALSGRSLSWANKVAPQAAAPQAYAPPEPLALAGQYMRGRTSAASRLDDLPPPPGQRRLAAAYAPGYQPFTPQEPYRPQGAPPAPRVTSDAPQLAPAPPPPPSATGLPTSLYSPPPADAAIGRPQQIAEAAAPAPTQAASGVGEGSRLYSVHRGYGLDPDAIPAPKGDNYVLIGPPDSGLAGGPPADNDDEPKDGQPF